jgi:hypothetical protein
VQCVLTLRLTLQVYSPGTGRPAHNASLFSGVHMGGLYDHLMNEHHRTGVEERLVLCGAAGTKLRIPSSESHSTLAVCDGSGGSQQSCKRKVCFGGMAARTGHG